MNFKILFITLSLLFLLGACADEETVQPEKIEIEMHGVGITETIAANDVITEVRAVLDEVEWQSAIPAMAEEPIATLTLLYPSVEGAPATVTEYDIWNNEDSGQLEIMGSKENQRYGTLNKENSQTLSDIMLENTIEKFSLE